MLHAMVICKGPFHRRATLPLMWFDGNICISQLALLAFWSRFATSTNPHPVKRTERKEASGVKLGRTRAGRCFQLLGPNMGHV